MVDTGREGNRITFVRGVGHRVVLSSATGGGAAPSNANPPSVDDEHVGVGVLIWLSERSASRTFSADSSASLRVPESVAYGSLIYERVRHMIYHPHVPCSALADPPSAMSAPVRCKRQKHCVYLV